MNEPDLETKTKTSSSILTSKLKNGAGQDATGEGLDRRIEKKTWTKKRMLLAGAVALFIVLIAYGFSTTLGGRKLNVETDKITVATVENAPFQEYFAATGNVLPQTTVFLDLPDGGLIEEIYVLEGQQVEQGTPLLRLSNNDLQLRMLSADASRIEQKNRLEDMRFRMEQNALNLRQQLAQMNYNILRLQREHDRLKQLYEKNLTSESDYLAVKDELEYWQRNKELTLQGYRTDSLRQVTQLRQMEISVVRMEQNFEVIEQILENLVYRAPVSGQLTAFDAEIGQIRNSGARLGQIDVLDGFKVRAGVDEFYISRVARGQTATTQPIAGVEYKMTVTRVYPEVRDGRFEVDLEFEDEVPPGIRRGQTIRFRLEMSDPAEALLLPRGGFFQTTGGNWVYVVDPSGDFATKRNIRIGRQNPQFFEVLEGLEPGDRVVTSSYDTFGDADRLVLK